MTPVPRRWPGETFVLLGSGPSLAAADVDAVRGRARVIAVNDAYRLAPWADVLYAADEQWWTWHEGVPSFTGPKYSIASSVPITWPGITVLRNTGATGLEYDPSGLRTGYNSGYQALNLAVHLGAARIVLLGYDLGPDAAGREHWFGDHPVVSASPYDLMRSAFLTLVEPLAALGIAVVNCSRQTTLRAFPCVPFDWELRTLTDGRAA